MANRKHLALLKKSVEKWNRWRERNSSAIPNLNGANLSGTDLSQANLDTAKLNGANLSEADLSEADLRRANLSEADLSGTDLRRANLREADLSGTDLRRVNLSEANLCDVNLSEANLRDADLSGADLHRANLRKANLRDASLRAANLRGADLSSTDLSDAHLGGADLREAHLSDAKLNDANLKNANLAGANLSDANLSGAILNGTDFTNSMMWDTVLVAVDLRAAKGLESVRQEGPSSVGIDTIYFSQGNIPEIFLRKAGLPEPFIVNMKALVGAMEPIQFYSCFISYSGKDQEFAERLYADLQQKNVRCWFDRENLKIGDEFRPKIDEAIRKYDKLLIVLSENSVKSPWVRAEVEKAFSKEVRFETELKERRTVLFPIRLDEAVMKTDEAWAADVKGTRHIGDFRQWKEHDEYQKAFARLMRDLQAEAAK